MKHHWKLITGITILAIMVITAAANNEPSTTAQYVDRILRPCAAGATPYVSVITTAAGNVALTTCVGGQATINGVPIGTGSGSVTSVGLALPVSVFSISGSPVTTSGTLTGTFANQASNSFFAGPIVGAAVPTFRVIDTADLGTGTANNTTFLRGDKTWQTVSGGITTLNTLTAATQTFAVGTAGTDFNIVSATSTHTFNIPDAGSLSRGLVTASNQEFGAIKGFGTLWIGPFAGPAMQLDDTNNLLRLSNDIDLSWTSGNASILPDIGLARNAAGILEVMDGQPGGGLRDLTARRLQTTIITVGALPACNAGLAGSRWAVSDALAPAFLVAVAAGGAVVTPVFCDGTNWVAG